jgi:hypothetical protein
MYCVSTQIATITKEAGKNAKFLASARLRMWINVKYWEMQRKLGGGEAAVSTWALSLRNAF